MRRRGWMAMGALVLGAMACGDSMGPPAVQGRDLEFTAPAVRSPSSETRYRTWDDPVTAEELARAKAASDAALSDGEDLFPWIHDSYALGDWDGDRFRLQYGMQGIGTGFSMGGVVRVTDGNGRAVPTAAVQGRIEDVGSYSSWRPHVEQTFATNVYCGANASASIGFAAVVKLAGVEVGHVEQTKSLGSAQARCEVSSTPTGGGVTYTSNGFKVYLCFYELWTDIDGDVIGVFFFGCTEVTGSVFAA